MVLVDRALAFVRVDSRSGRPERLSLILQRGGRVHSGVLDRLLRIRRPQPRGRRCGERCRSAVETKKASRRGHDRWRRRRRAAVWSAKPRSPGCATQPASRSGWPLDGSRPPSHSCARGVKTVSFGCLNRYRDQLLLVATPVSSGTLIILTNRGLTVDPVLAQLVYHSLHRARSKSMASLIGTADTPPIRR
jgi:hypothetical protein